MPGRNGREGGKQSRVGLGSGRGCRAQEFQKGAHQGKSEGETQGACWQPA